MDTAIDVAARGSSETLTDNEKLKIVNAWFTPDEPVQKPPAPPKKEPVFEKEGSELIKTLQSQVEFLAKEKQKI